MKMLSIEEQRRRREADYFNVTDDLKGLEIDQVKNIMESNRAELAIIGYNQIRDINWGSLVRSANGFNCEVCFSGRKNYDRRGAVGAHKYMDIKYMPSIIDCIEHYRSMDYEVIAAEYTDSYIDHSLFEWSFRPKTAIVFGEESSTLEDYILEKVDAVVHIPMYGSVRSFNLASTASMFMMEYRRQEWQATSKWQSTNRKPWIT